MMRVLLLLLTLGGSATAMAASTTSSPQSNNYCFNGTAWAPCTPTNPLATTGSGGGGTAQTNYALEGGGNLAAILAALNATNTALAGVAAAINNPIPMSPEHNCSGT